MSDDRRDGDGTGRGDDNFGLIDGAWAHPGSAPVDFAFLDEQTFADRDLQIEVLGLFVAQADRLLRDLPDLDARRQGDIAHLLKGSARGIGAWPAASASAAYEAADAMGRVALHGDLVATFGRAQDAIRAWLAAA